MRLAPKLWLIGAIVPSLGALIALILAGLFFRASLHRDLDRALLAQAAVESASLFDGPRGEVHLHMSRSPLLEEVRRFAPSARVYDPSGALILRFPENEAAEARLAPPTREAPPRLFTSTGARGEVRVLEVVVRAPPPGGLHVLRLEASLASIAATERGFLTVTAIFAWVFCAVLLAFQGVAARRITQRIAVLGQHMGRLARGNLEDVPTEDAGDDEISDLRREVVHATRELRAHRLARERLLADAAHELKTPLASMRVALDLALRRPRAPEELREALESTRDEVERLGRLAEGLLDLTAAGGAPWRLEAVAISSVVEEAVRGISERARAREITLEVEPSEAVVRASPVALRQALDNLLDNAVKFSPPGSPIRVSISRAAGGWELLVDDAGPGVPEAERELVFEAFHRLSHQVEGNGLGLALVRDIALRHGGRVRVEPSPLGGARFALWLPS